MPRYCILIITFLIFTLLFLSYTVISQPAVAQSSSSSSGSAIKGLLIRTIQALKSGSTNKTLEHLNAIDQELSSLNLFHATIVQS
jgi:hypothetical protein